MPTVSAQTIGQASAGRSAGVSTAGQSSRSDARAATVQFQLFQLCIRIVAETLLAAGACLVLIGLGGWLFWKLVRVMGRIQAGEHRDGR